MTSPTSPTTMIARNTFHAPLAYTVHTPRAGAGQSDHRRRPGEPAALRWIPRTRPGSVSRTSTSSPASRCRLEGSPDMPDLEGHAARTPAPASPRDLREPLAADVAGSGGIPGRIALAGTEQR